MRPCLQLSRFRSVYLPLLGLASLACGCDRLGVKDFGGAKILMSISGATTTPAGSHLELWVRDAVSDSSADQSIIRVLGADGRHPDTTPCASGVYCPRAAYKIVPAIDLNDGCMIDTAGHFLWAPDAQAGASDKERNLASDAVLKRICQLVGGVPGTNDIVVRETKGRPECPAAGCSCKDLGAYSGLAPLFGMVSWDDASAQRPTLADTEMLDAAARLRACSDSLEDGSPNPACFNKAKDGSPDVGSPILDAPGCFWAKAPFAYTGSPLQTTHPVHGVLYGVADFVSMTTATNPAPPQILGGIHIDTDWALLHAREMWFTQTTATLAALDPSNTDCTGSAATCRGTVVLDLVEVPGGTGTIAFAQGPSMGGGLSGAASIQIALDQTPEQF
jgi:hypothetical protein